MRLPLAEAGTPCLSDAAAGRHDVGRFIADEATTWQPNAATEAVRAPYRDRSVLLALPGQLRTLAALLALDGVARRIVLWPNDTPPAALENLVRAAAIDLVLTEFPLTASAEADAPAGAERETEWVLFTSGTSGEPKMVVHSLRTLAGHILGSRSRAAPKIWCTFYDIRRYGGLQIALRALLGGGSLVLSCPSEPPDAFLARAAAAGATHFLGTPSHWRRALMTDAAHKLRPDYVRLSGEVADRTILDRLAETYPSAELVHAFASTEAGLAFEITDRLPGFSPSVLENPPAGVELSIRNGSLHIRSPRVARGYLNGAIEPIAGPDGTVDTGDSVELRGDRYIFAGRRDGTINVGGQKVHPEEVEAVINLHPAVVMAAVMGRGNPVTGAVVVADIVVRNPVTARDLGQFCRARLEAHKVPAIIRIVDRLPIGPGGKLVRRHA
jgi:acyl-CoA synthetase (AMP-forming)/AMP-acid ligase II